MLVQDLIEGESRWPNDKLKKLVDDEFDIDRMHGHSDKRFKEYENKSIPELKKLQQAYIKHSEWIPNESNTDPLERYEAKKEAQLLQQAIMAKED